MPDDPVVIAHRYQLLERLGSGAMGEVWKARDLKFESLVVAVKLLKEDDTRRDDAMNREKLAYQIHRDAVDGEISSSIAVMLLDDVLQSGKGTDQLETRVTAASGSSGRLTLDAVLRLFDELVGDPVVCESARIRARMRRLFRTEANSVAGLRHENIVGISDYGDHDGVPFLAMDFIEGRTLTRALKAEAPDLVRRLRWMEHLCSGLAFAHRRHLVHRDIKPANLMIDQATDTLKILDFGVVRRLHDAAESTIGLQVGTLCYMSPEQIMGSPHVDHRSDVFSVGVVFYEVLTGQRAFPAGEGIPDLLGRIRLASPRPVTDFDPGIDPDIVAVLDRAIAKTPEDRYQDLGDMRREIAGIRLRLESSRTQVIVVEKTAVEDVLETDATRVISRVEMYIADGRLDEAMRLLENGETIYPYAARQLRELQNRVARERAEAEARRRADAAARERVEAEKRRRESAERERVQQEEIEAARQRELEDAKRRAAEESTNRTTAKREAERRTPRRLGFVAAGIAVVAAAGGSYLYFEGGPPVGGPPVDRPVSAVTVNFQPWARVRIEGIGDAKPPDPERAYTTPFVVNLPPGRFRLHASNDTLETSEAVEIDVRPGQPTVVDRPLKGFDPDVLVNELIGPAAPR